MFKSSASKKRKREPGTVSSWIESTFCRRECNRFLPSAKDNSRCCCGNLWQYHSDGSPATLQHTVKGDDHWSPLRHTTLHPTDAYGTIEFQDGAHPSKAQYARVAYDTRPEQLLQLLVSAWRLELPKLLITVHGGKANFELQPKLKKALRRGLLKAARTTGAWVFTGGTNTGVTRHAGDALASGQSLRLGGQHAVCIGIAPWGVIDGRHEQLIGLSREVPYHVAQGRLSRCASLNSRHTHFLLADNGTAGRYGAEYVLRRALEKHISSQRQMTRGGQGTPLVCVVIEGGSNTVRAILEYVTDSPPVPVVVCDGTGRASDIVSFVYRHLHSAGGAVLLAVPEMREHLVRTVRDTFGLARQEQAERLLSEIIQCCRHKELITVYRYQEGLELDEAMLKALLQGYHLRPTDQLNLALSWNRVDIARCTVFATPQEWPPGSLEQAMMDALVNDRIDFVKLLLENGVIMSKFLTLARLEELYNAKQGPPNSLHYIVQDVRKNYSRGRYSLLDIGLVINHLMGGAYRSTYSRRKFRALYYETFRFRSPMIVRNASMFMRAAACATTAVAAAAPLKMSPPANGRPPPDTSAGPAASRCAPTEDVFEYPFSELMIWAVLTKRQAMAHLMWQHGEEALAKALVACKLFKALSCEAAKDNLETEFFEELKRHAAQFESLGTVALPSFRSSTLKYAKYRSPLKYRKPG
ncbi:transient receptor potential cation channel trpm-like [Amphibalanus amphitrite]|uniref:transient receptor potential cation channel trpm-like n=1 Tax=Amphibalanus amphitrite TaxID=1232801 RepID=UPI001C914E36|nr:transient receptor potential cation channel trpm-like [Amphibalanus amphitrite]